MELDQVDLVSCRSVPGLLLYDTADLRHKERKIADDEYNAFEYDRNRIAVPQKRKEIAATLHVLFVMMSSSLD